MAAKILNVNLLFSCFLAAAFGYGIFEAKDYAFLAKIFPFYISIVLFIMAVINIIMEIRWAAHGSKNTGAGFSDLGTDWDIPISKVWLRFAKYLGMMIAMYVGVWLIGYPLCISLFIILFYRYIAGTKWHWSIVAGLAAIGFLALVSQLLNMDWPQGIILLPWPLG